MKERSDKGMIRINPRDMRCLEWILEMGSVYEDDLTLVLSPRNPISVGAARAVVRRWEQAGLAHAQPLFANRGRLVRLTEEGAFLVGGHRSWEETDVAHAAHAADVARARFLLEQFPSTVNGRRVVGWVGRRRWLLEHPATEPDAVAPDGVARFDDGTLGVVRIERAHPGAAVTLAAATEFLSTYPVVVFAFPEAAEGIRATVRNAVTLASDALKKDGKVPGEVCYLDIPSRFDAYPAQPQIPSQ